MRHRRGYRLLNRTSAHRRALLRNLSTALITHEAIRTTLPKAKTLRPVVERMITRAKPATKGAPPLARRRLAFARLRDNAAVAKLFDDLAPRFAGRPGGYTRILKDGFREGDNAPMARIEFVERREEEPPTVKPDKSGKSDKKTDE